MGRQSCEEGIIGRGLCRNLVGVAGMALAVPDAGEIDALTCSPGGADDRFKPAPGKESASRLAIEQFQRTAGSAQGFSELGNKLVHARCPLFPATPPSY